MPKLTPQTTDLIVTSALNLAVACIPQLIAYFAARNETITEAGAMARLEELGIPMIARNEAWLIMKGALTVADEGTPDPTP